MIADGGDEGGVCGDSINRAALAKVPDASCVVLGASGDVMSVACKVHAKDLLGVATHHVDTLATAKIPHATDVVRSSCTGEGAIRMEGNGVHASGVSLLHK